MRRRNLQTGFISVTAAMLALHTMLGCCWHHAHQCSENCAATSSVASPVAEHVDECGDSGPCSHDQHGHHGRHSCQGGTCIFVGPSRVNWQQFSLPLAAPIALPSLTEAVALDVRPASPAFEADAPAPPVRRHLLDQVLLI